MTLRMNPTRNGGIADADAILHGPEANASNQLILL